MKISPGSSVNRAAFTLIELLTVMAIILVLAGLIINVAGSSHYNSAKARATGEIKALETALENYKADNGAYPQDPNTPTDVTQSPPTTMLDPRGVSDTANTDPNNMRYKVNSEFLYQTLSGFPVKVSGTTGAAATPTPSATVQTMSKAYMKFPPGQLQIATFESNAPTAVTANSPYMYIVDPFGFSYGYSTVYAATQAYNNSQGTSSAGGASTPTPATAVTVGYNPTFDLWSTAGYAPGGKGTPNTSPSGMSKADFYSSIWIKNW